MQRMTLTNTSREACVERHEKLLRAPIAGPVGKIVEHEDVDVVEGDVLCDLLR